MHNSPIPTLPPFPKPCFWTHPLCPSSIKPLCPPPSLVPKPWVCSPEVDHFNSASWIFFKKDLRPGDPRTSDRGLNPDQPAGLRALVNTAIISHAPFSTPQFCSLPIRHREYLIRPTKVSAPTQFVGYMNMTHLTHAVVQYLYGQYMEGRRKAIK